MTTETSRAAWQGLRVQQRALEALQAAQALIAQGQTDFTRNEVDRYMVDKLEAEGGRRISPSWGCRAASLVAQGIWVRVEDRPCRASASRSPCQAYAFASMARGRSVSLSCSMTAGSSMTGEPVVTSALETFLDMFPLLFGGHA